MSDSSPLKKQLELWHLIVGLVLVMTGGLTTAAMAWQSTQERLKAVEEKARSQEMLIDDLRQSVVEIKTDTRWIRERLR